MGKIKRRKGFTLVEVIIAVALTVVVVAAVYNAWQYLNISYKNQKENASVQMDAQNAINTIVAELKRGDTGSGGNIKVPAIPTEPNTIEITDNSGVKWTYKANGVATGYNEMSLIKQDNSTPPNTATIAHRISGFEVSKDATTNIIKVTITVRLKQKDAKGTSGTPIDKKFEGQYKQRTGIIN